MILTQSQIKAFELLQTVAEYLENEGGYIDWHELKTLGWQNPVELLLSLVTPAMHLPSGELESTEWLQDAFEDIVHCCLQELVITVREEHQQALDDWQHLQDVLVKLMDDPDINTEVLHWLVHGITEIGLRPSDEFLDADRQWQTQMFEARVDHVDFESNPDALFDTLQEMLVDYSISDEFELYELFFNQLTHLPPGVGEEMVASFLEVDNPILRETAVLFLLHPQAEIRNNVLHLIELEFYTNSITSTGLRRMITMRNWLQAAERRRLDNIIKRVRKAGVVCESAKPPAGSSIVRVVASSIDGAGAQTVVTVFKVGKKFRLAGSVFKERFGIVDTWITLPITRKECEEIIARIQDEVLAIEVDQQYIELLLPHFIVLNVQSGHSVSPEVLQWIELLGIDCWQPQSIDIDHRLKKWNEAYSEKLTASYISKSLVKSGKWLGKKRFTMGWFEQDDSTGKILGEVLEILRLGNNKLSLEKFLSQSVMEPVRQKWLHRFIILTIWAENALKKRGLDTIDFFILARALADGTPMDQIPLMVAIAGDSLMNFINDGELSHANMDPNGGLIEVDLEDEADQIITADEEQALENFLLSSKVPSHTLNFHELQGLMYATVCAPELPLPTHWLKAVFGGQLPDETESKWGEQLKILFKYYNNIMSAADAGDSFIPCDLNYEHQGYDYFPLSAWCKGVISGIECSGGEGLWRNSLPIKEREHFNKLIKATSNLSKYDGLPFTRKNLPELGVIDELLGLMDFMAANRKRRVAKG